MEEQSINSKETADKVDRPRDNFTKKGLDKSRSAANGIVTNISTEHKMSRKQFVKIKTLFVEEGKIGDCQNTNENKRATKKLFECQVCDKSYATGLILNRHEQTHSDREFICSHCGKSFNQKQKLAEHIAVHTGVKPFKCTQCEKAFPFKWKLTAHVKNHPAQSHSVPYTCLECGRHFVYETNYNKHMALHRKPKELKKPIAFECTMCEKTFKRRSVLMTHLRIHAGDRPFGCSQCGKHFPSKQYLKIHLKIHQVITRFKCLVCGKYFISPFKLSVHMRTHTGEKPFCCSHCRLWFSDKVCLVRHVEVTHSSEDKPFSCFHCGKSFKLKCYLREHIKTHKGFSKCNQKIPRKRTSKTRSKMHVKPSSVAIKHYCLECGQLFAKKEDLTKHSSTHTSSKPINCAMCDKSFVKKRQLEQHLITHTGTKAFQCTICGKSLYHKTSLQAHLKRHDGSNRFTCAQCGNNFTKKCNLVVHAMRHMGITPFKCAVCEKTFTVRSQLRYHMRTHTNERPFSCFHCGISYKNKVSMILHVMLKHRFHTHQIEREKNETCEDNSSKKLVT